MPEPVEAANRLIGDFQTVEDGCVTPDGLTWVLANNRILRLTGQSWSRVDVDGLPAMKARLIAISCGADGALWVASTQSGVWQLVRKGDRLRASPLELPASLRGLTPLAVLSDRRGWIWLGTDQGLAVWNGRVWRHLTRQDGLIWDDVNQGLVREDQDGSIRIGTSGGIARLLHPEALFERAPLQLRIAWLSRGGQRLNSSAELRLTWSPEPLRIQLAAPRSHVREEVAYRFRIPGLQPQWSTQSSGELAIANIAPGDYRLEAMVCELESTHCSEPALLHFHILPPWWRTVWFYLLCALLVILALIGAERLHVARLRRNTLRLEHIVAERTKELKASQQELEHRATHDALTGLLNRGAILERLSQQMERSAREQRTLLVMLADIDHFKHINDSYGHLAGDEALRQFARRIRDAIRSYDAVGRYGGEEFLALAEEGAQPIELERANRFQTEISGFTVCHKQNGFRVTCSVGVTLYCPALGHQTPESLLAAADSALYQAKEAGRNRCCFHCLYTSHCGQDCAWS